MIHIIHQRTNTLGIALSMPADTSLRAILHPFDRYSLALELDDAGKPAPWDTVMGWETCGQVQDWAGMVEA